MLNIMTTFRVFPIESHSAPKNLKCKKSGPEFGDRSINYLNLETLHLESSKVPENKFSVSCYSGKSPCRRLVTREVAHL